MQLMPIHHSSPAIVCSAFEVYDLDPYINYNRKDCS